MEILKKAFGDLGTNCYIIKSKNGEIVIDPGVGSFAWVRANTDKILAVFNTHGHFDHSYDDSDLQGLGANIYIHEKDAFMLESNAFKMRKDTCIADVKFSEGEFSFGGMRLKIHHYPGHTPGSVMIEIGEYMFSGDFLFCGTIGRFDFPYSSAMDMKSSLEKLKNFTRNLAHDYTLLPGHGKSSTLLTEAKFIDYYLNMF